MTALSRLIKGVFGAALLSVLIAQGALGKDKVVGMSERVFEVLGEAQAALDLEDYAGARAILETSLERKASTYERAHMLNVIGYSWYEEDELDRALDVYAEALALEDLPQSMLVTLRLTMGQVNLVNEDYSEAEKHLRALLALPEQNIPSNEVLLAASLMGQERFADALPPLQRAIAAEEAGGNPPRENWLSMLASVYYETDDFGAMRDVIERLVLLYPREQYVMNLAALHGQLGDSEKQLALVESLLDDDRLEQPSNLRMIVSLYLGEELPYKAATLLDRELASGRIESTVSNLEMLSQAWYMSAETEKAIAPLAKAAELSESGDLYLRLARLHMDAYQWAEASAAATSAIDKGGLRQEGQAWLLGGMANVRLKKFANAREQFKEALQYEYTEKYADQWLKYASAEEQRIAATTN
jgi:tetratricopeptide (TPR) repeat protein